LSSTGEWYKGDVMAIIDEALATGGDPNVSDAFTINGQPGDLYNCSSGIKKIDNLKDHKSCIRR
jgi:hypothetical protein